MISALVGIIYGLRACRNADICRAIGAVSSIMCLFLQMLIPSDWLGARYWILSLARWAKVERPESFRFAASARFSQDFGWTGAMLLAERVTSRWRCDYLTGSY
ncbi:MAG: hypothetical protein ACJ0K4_01245 [Verrucomicrobiales bacterium]